MSQAVADGLRHVRRIVVNDAFRLCPDADALVANDKAWWGGNPDAFKFAGRKFSTNPPAKVEMVRPTAIITTTCNSATLGLHVALTVFKATHVLLYGVDCSAVNGAHYFGPHKSKLRNTPPARFEVFKKQWAAYAKTLPPGIEVFNATPGSAIECFPFLG